MLILTRKPGESLYIGDNIKVTVVEVKGSQVRLGIAADKSVRIYREEIWLQILEENKKAAEAARSHEQGLEGLSEAWRGSQGGQPGEAPKPPSIRSPDSMMTRDSQRGPSMPLGEASGAAPKRREEPQGPEILRKPKKKREEDIP